MENDGSSFQEELKCLQNLTETLNAKDAKNSIKLFKNIEPNIRPLIIAFSEFPKSCEEMSEVCKYYGTELLK